MINYLDEVDQVLKDYTPTEAAALMNSIGGTTLEKILSFQWHGITYSDQLTKFRTSLFKMKSCGASDIEINNYIDYAKTVEDVAGSDVFITKPSEINQLNQFQSLAWEAEQASYYRGLVSSADKMTIQSLKGRVEFTVELPDTKTYYIECKRPDGGFLTDSSLRNALQSGQEKFMDKDGIIRNDPAILAIDARNGIQIIVRGTVVNVEDYTTSFMNEAYPIKNYIKQVKIFTGENIRLGKWNYETRVYEWETVA